MTKTRLLQTLADKKTCHPALLFGEFGDSEPIITPEETPLLSLAFLLANQYDVRDTVGGKDYPLSSPWWGRWETWKDSAVAYHANLALENARKVIPEGWNDLEWAEKISIMLPGHPDESEDDGGLVFRFGKDAIHHGFGLRIVLGVGYAPTLMNDEGYPFLKWDLYEVREDRDDGVGMVNREWCPITLGDFAPCTNNAGLSKLADGTNLSFQYLPDALIYCDAYERMQWLRRAMLAHSECAMDEENF